MSGITAKERERYAKIMSENLTDIRKTADLTQVQLAELIGVSRQTIHNIEVGKTPLKWHLFISIYLLANLDYRSKSYIESIGIKREDLKAFIYKIREV